VKDYHDLWIANLERIAEEQHNKANTALQAGEADALERVQQWSKTLAGIRQIKNTATIPRPTKKVSAAAEELWPRTTPG